jgi:serine/threonine protein kinase
MIGTTISHYRVIGRLGAGGMGVVYEAENERLPRRVALKLISEDLATNRFQVAPSTAVTVTPGSTPPVESVEDPNATKRLKREAATIALLNHPNICTIYEVDEHEGRTFIAMERLEGVNLKTHMARKTLGTPEILEISLQIVGALEAAHAQGIVHRDIKPGNIFICTNGQVKVLDFGLARRLLLGEGTLPDGSTIPGRPIGTASYMAPERILQMPMDARCDLFSLGVVIYEMATGRLPFAGASPAETVTSVLEHEPPPLTTLSPTRPGQLHRIVNKLVAKLADERYQSAAELRSDLLTLQSRFGDTFMQRLFGRIFHIGRSTNRP